MESGTSTDIQPTRESRKAGEGPVALPGTRNPQCADGSELESLDQESNIIRGED
ncbi:hypothetical protein [Streptomyces sp. NPDC093544]|jgi:hypothetical protein|uniref:hypothetical protein n=1 Tax=Streptomyces sp. NPDC093544 TaxID=3155200 RepID=UPI00343E1A7D